MKIENYHLGFVGLGRTGQMILRAIEASKLIPRSNILFFRRDPAKAKQNEQEFGITSTTLSHLVDSSNLLLICTPSSQAEFVLQDLTRAGAGAKMIVSIMGGVKLAFLQRYLGPKSQVARAAPNVAISAREGMSLVTFAPQPSLEFRSVVNLLFASMGQVMEIPESQIVFANSMADSGCGIVFEIIDAMARLGEKEGMTYAKALKISSQAFLGAAQMVLKGTLPQDILMQMTISTEYPASAAIETFRKGDVVKHIQAAIRASAARSEKLSEEFF